MPPRYLLEPWVFPIKPKIIIVLWQQKKLACWKLKGARLGLFFISFRFRRSSSSLLRASSFSIFAFFFISSFSALRAVASGSIKTSALCCCRGSLHIKYNSDTDRIDGSVWNCSCHEIRTSLNFFCTRLSAVRSEAICRSASVSWPSANEPRMCNSY